MTTQEINELQAIVDEWRRQASLVKDWGFKASVVKSGYLTRANELQAFIDKQEKE